MSEPLRAFSPGVYYDVETDTFRVEPAASIAHPFSLCIHVNRRCNLECFYCLSDSGPRRPGVTGRIHDLLHTLQKWAPMRLVWSGGEPLMEPTLPHRLDIAEASGFINVVTTNGTIMPRWMLRERIHWIDVSIHGVDRENYAANCGRDAFDLVLSNLAAMVESGVRASACIVLTRSSLPGLSALAQRLANIGVQRFRVSRLLPLGRGESALAADVSDIDALTVRQRLATVAQQLAVIYPAVRKRALLIDGYFVVENDGRLSSPTALLGIDIFDAAMSPHWPSALRSHLALFDGTAD